MMDGLMPARGTGNCAASLVNTYDEVLEKEYAIRGTITVWLAKDPGARRTIPLTIGELAYPAVNGRRIALLPGDSARFVITWDQRTDEGLPFWSGTRLTRLVDSKGVPYLESDPVEFVAQATVQLFANVQPRTSTSIHYTSIYRLYESESGNN